MTAAHQYSSVSDASDAKGGSAEQRRAIDWTVTVLGIAGGVTFAWAGLLSWMALRAVSNLFG